MCNLILAAPYNKISKNSSQLHYYFAEKQWKFTIFVVRLSVLFFEEQNSYLKETETKIDKILFQMNGLLKHISVLAPTTSTTTTTTPPPTTTTTTSTTTTPTAPTTASTTMKITRKPSSKPVTPPWRQGQRPPIVMAYPPRNRPVDEDRVRFQ